MLNLNNVILCGRLTADPEVKQNKNGTSVLSANLAVNRPKDKDGNVTADFIRVTFFGKNADNIGKYCHKGDGLYVEASVRTGKYEKDGKTVYTTDFWANRIMFADKAGAKKNDAPAEEEYDVIPSADDSDDLPF